MTRFLLFTFLVFNISAFGQHLKELNLNRITSEIEIDGKIDKLWSLADSVSDFHQHSPNYGDEPSMKTVTKVVTNDQNLYCLIKCYDSLENIEIQTGNHDDFSGDIVSFMIDTFNDKRTAYKFAVSASGVTSDCRLLDDARNRDYNWDGIWFAASEVYDWGFVVEIKIPYKSIKFDPNADSWGLDFDRWNPKRAEDIYWVKYDRAEGQRVSKFGKLNLNGFKPKVEGLSLEIYPVGISKLKYVGNDKYEDEYDFGLDILYNPSSKLTYQFTANPDFAQIEADPYDFNISRYESYFSEKRPFFTEGAEIFMASGKERNSGFYSPMELFYSRRIGKVLSDGQEVPLLVGTKASGRIDDFEYGGLLALTGEKSYKDNDEELKEERAIYGVARLKKQIMDNSSIGILYAGKHDKNGSSGVLDVDGAFRGGNWQLSYQLATSIKENSNGYALSSSFRKFTDKWATFLKIRAVDKKFDVDEIGFVPWKGTLNSAVFTGPVWFYDDGPVQQMFIYGGVMTNYEDYDLYADRMGIVGFNFNFRKNWGFEINLYSGKAKDSNVKYSYRELSISTWFHPSPKYSLNIWGGYSKTYNFSRDYLGYYGRISSSFSYRVHKILKLGTSFKMYIEQDPDGNIDDITYNARPYISFNPVNNLNFRLYVDNVYLKSSDKLERVFLGFLFSYNFSPKSWIYLAINELHNRSDEFDSEGRLLPHRMHLVNRAGIFKIKYLYYL